MGTLPMLREVGLIIVGDEILSGRRREAHIPQTAALIAPHGVSLVWAWVVGDDRERLVHRLAESRREGGAVLVFGGIGATPDDHTRQAAARAWGVPLERHGEAARSIEERFGAAAHPHRIRMADLPAGCGLIPNPQTRIPGFFLDRHHFLPGFPEMAPPMLAWILEHRFRLAASPEVVRALVLPRAREGDLIPLLEAVEEEFPGVRSFSLPSRGAEAAIELGVKGGDAGLVEGAHARLCALLTGAGIGFRLAGDGERGSAE